MTLPSALKILTIGHSTHSNAQFLALLRRAEVTAIADVRSAPFSRRFPHFCLDALQTNLLREGIVYSFLDKELGGRPQDARFFRSGVADYEAMASTQDFEGGLDRLLQAAGKYRLALMCAERHPLDCHRCLLVGRALSRRCVAVDHILPDGSVSSQLDVEDSLLVLAAGDQEDLFASREERLNAAYRVQAHKIAFRLKS